MTVTRLCGHRAPGGAYLEVGLSELGRPIEEFLFDPPVPVDTVALGLSSVGVKPVSDHQVTHVFDVVGGVYYPNAADIIEETRRHGLSRRIPKTFPVELLSATSKIVLLHRRGYIENYVDYYREIFGGRWYWHLCPKRRKEHMDPSAWPSEMCCGVWWHDLSEGTHDGGVLSRAYGRVRRALPAEEFYDGWQRPARVTPTYHTAIIAAFPVSRIAVVRDATEGSHAEVLDRFQSAGVDVVMVDH